MFLVALNQRLFGMGVANWMGGEKFDEPFPR
jgi:hypothetical protein